MKTSITDTLNERNDSYQANELSLVYCVLSGMEKQAESLAYALDAMIKSARDKHCGLKLADDAPFYYKTFQHITLQNLK